MFESAIELFLSSTQLQWPLRVKVTQLYIDKVMLDPMTPKNLNAVTFLADVLVV